MHNDDVPCTCHDCELHRFTETGHKVIVVLSILTMVFVFWLAFQ